MTIFPNLDRNLNYHHVRMCAEALALQGEHEAAARLFDRIDEHERAQAERSKLN